MQAAAQDPGKQGIAAHSRVTVEGTLLAWQPGRQL